MWYWRLCDCVRSLVFVNRVESLEKFPNPICFIYVADISNFHSTSIRWNEPVLRSAERYTNLTSFHFFLFKGERATAIINIIHTNKQQLRSPSTYPSNYARQQPLDHQQVSRKNATILFSLLLFIWSVCSRGFFCASVGLWICSASLILMFLVPSTGIGYETDGERKKYQSVNPNKEQKGQLETVLCI